MAVALQHFDLVAVRVLHEEKAGDEPVAILEFLDVVGSEAQRFHSRMFAVEIVDTDRDVPVARAVGVRLGAPLVERELEFEIVFRIAQIGKRELGKVKLLGDTQSEGVAVEIQRPFQVEDPDHGVDHLSQRRLPYASKGRVAAQLVGAVWYRDRALSRSCRNVAERSGSCNARNPCRQSRTTRHWRSIRCKKGTSPFGARCSGGSEVIEARSIARGPQRSALRTKHQPPRCRTKNEVRRTQASYE